MGVNFRGLAPVVQTLDSAIQRISIWETNCTIHWIEIIHRIALSTF